MPWDNSPEKRRRDAQTYGSAEYRRNRAIAERRAAGRCEKCGHRHPTQCDHVIPRTQGGTHHHENLQMLCAGRGTCQCHEKKTAGEGGGFRKPQSAIDPEPRPKTKWT
jgi:5-methylcytosine-specific restriction endonuclease McrA